MTDVAVLLLFVLILLLGSGRLTALFDAVAKKYLPEYKLEDDDPVDAKLAREKLMDLLDTKVALYEIGGDEFPVRPEHDTPERRAVAARLHAQFEELVKLLVR